MRKGVAGRLRGRSAPRAGTLRARTLAVLRSRSGGVLAAEVASVVGATRLEVASALSMMRAHGFVRAERVGGRNVWWAK